MLHETYINKVLICLLAFFVLGSFALPQFENIFVIVFENQVTLLFLPPTLAFAISKWI